MIEKNNFEACDSSDNSGHGITIGIPLYNEELFIEQSVRSAAPQCEILMIVDNCSTDHSANICQALAKEYPNLVYIRRTRNQGAFNNFKFVMSEAATPYFMWLGAHDVIPPNYVKLLKEALENDSTAMLAYSAVTHIDRYGKTISHYAYPFSSQLANEDPKKRFHAITKRLTDCSLIHGIFRTPALKEAWLHVPYRGGDHVLLAKAAILGKFLYIPSISLLRRDVHLFDSTAKQLERITGLKPQQSSASYQDMQRALHALAVNEFGYSKWRSALFCFNIRYWLIVRHGPFSEHWVTNLLEMLIFQAGRPVRVCFRKLMAIYNAPSTLEHE